MQIGPNLHCMHKILLVHESVGASVFNDLALYYPKVRYHDHVS